MVRPLLERVDTHVHASTETSNMNEPRHKPTAKETVAAAFAWLKAFVRELDESRTTGMAAELAFWLFLSLIPLAAVAGLAAARVAVGSERVPEVLESLPPETRNLIQEQLAAVAAWNGGRVAAPAAVVFLWLGSGGISAVFDLLEVKSGASRPWWKRRVLALATCIGLSIGGALIALVLTGLDRFLAMVRGALPWEIPSTAGAVNSAGRLVIGIATAVALVAGLYRVGVPRVARTNRVVWPGALLAVGLQTVLGYGYGFYLSKVGTHSAYQAGLSIIGITMIALYLFSLALLIGAELNHVIGKRRAENHAPAQNK
jgi:membrane protein